MVKSHHNTPWLTKTIKLIHKLAQEKRVAFTHKATLEVSNLDFGLDFDDVCDVLMALNKQDFKERLKSHATGEWLYIFKPEIACTVIYTKLLLRRDCIVISFHEDDYEK